MQLLMLWQVMVVFCRAGNPVETSVSTSANLDVCQPEQDIQTCLCSVEKPFNGVVSCVYVGKNKTSRVLVSDQNCVTYDNATRMPLSGECPFRFSDIQLSGDKTMAELNALMCGELRRSGRLCGACDNPSQFSFNTLIMQCLPNCPVVTWTVYLIMDLVPIVVFFVAVVAFNIRATSPSANAFILYAQVISLGANILAIERDWTFALGKANDSSLPQTVARGLAYFYSIWSLDIVDAFYPSLCLNETSHRVGTLQAFAFQYVSAVFSLVLTASIYFFIELYWRNFRIVVFAWKPFRMCFAKLRRNTDLHDRKTSIIDIFATFVVLSYTKFTVASFQILAPAWTHTLSGEKKKLVMYYDGTVSYFGQEHKAYAALAIVVLVIFVLPPPLLLFVYPLRCCQRWLDRLKLRSHLITAFTDAFQGCFKNGCNNTRDCRCFAGIYFLLRIIIIGLYAFAVYKTTLLSLLLMCTVVAVTILFVIIEPYKNSFYNKLDITSMLYYIFVVNLMTFNSSLIARSTPSVVFQYFYSFAISVPMIVVFLKIATIFIQKLHKKYHIWLLKGTYEDHLGKSLDSSRSLLSREENGSDGSECLSSNESITLD